MYLNLLISIDEIYLTFILLILVFVLILSIKTNTNIIKFKMVPFLTYFAIFLNFMYALTSTYIVYNIYIYDIVNITNLFEQYTLISPDFFSIIINNIWFENLNISFLFFDLFIAEQFIFDFDYENINDYIIKITITLGVSFWFIIYYNFINNKYTKKENTNYEPIILYLLITYLLLKLIISKDMLMFVVTMESQNLALCIICAYTILDKGVSKIEAALKLYITSAASSGFLLLGCSLIYGITGSINFIEIALQLKSRSFEQVLYLLENIIQNINFDKNTIIFYYSTISINDKITILLFIVGILCFFVSIAFKIGQVPFHLWMSDVYNGGNVIFVSYLAIFPKIAIGYFFLKLIIFYFSYNFLLLKILFISGFLTIIIGILGAMYQKKIKSFIAYSSIANLGYLILLSSTATIINDNLLLTIGILFIINYAIIMLQIFINLISNIYTINFNTNKQIKEIINLNELSGYWKINKINCIFLIVSFLSLIGIPPIIGFLIKFYISIILISHNLILVSWCFLILGVFSTFYYLKIIKILIMDNINKNLFLINGDIKNKIIQLFITLLQTTLFFKPLIFIILYIILV